MEHETCISSLIIVTDLGMPCALLLNLSKGIYSAISLPPLSVANGALVDGFQHLDRCFDVFQ